MNTVTRESENPTLAYKLAQKLLDEMIKKLLDKVFYFNGIPLPIAEPHKKLFSQYGKKMIELYGTALKYDADWRHLIELNEQLNRNSMDVFAYIKSSPTVAGDPFGPAILFEALLSPSTAQAAIAERDELRKGALDLVEKFDGILSGQEEILAFTTVVLRRLNIFLETDIPQNNFDVVLGRGALVRGAGDVCYSASRFHESYAALLRHRNEWAQIVSKAPRRPRTLGQLSSLCPM